MFAKQKVKQDKKKQSKETAFSEESKEKAGTILLFCFRFDGNLNSKK